MTASMLQTSAALCFAVAIVLTTVSVWFRFRYVARGIVNVPSFGAILHAGWIFDTLIRNRVDKVPGEAIQVGEWAGIIWVIAGGIALACAWKYHAAHGSADDHGEPCTQRAFESEKTRSAREMRELKRSGGHCVAVRR